MIEILDICYKIIINDIYPPLFSLIKTVGNSPLYFIILVVVFIMLIKIKDKPTNNFLNKLLSTLGFFTLIFLIAVIFVQILPPIVNYLTSEDGTSSNVVKTTGQVQNGTKKRYYSASCSTCSNSSCPKNGYNYYGTDVNSYNQYVNLCKNCSCLTIKNYSLLK